MDVNQFIGSLNRLDVDAIVATAADLEERASSAAGEVTWWRATVEIDRQLKACRAGRRAAVAASRAAAAVIHAAAAGGLPTADQRVTAVARAAADVARGLEVSAPAADELLEGCRRLVAA
jgi:hypothetical protein